MAEAVKFKYSRYKKIQVRDISPACIVFDIQVLNQHHRIGDIGSDF